MRYTAVQSSIRVCFITLTATTLGCSTKHYQITLKPEGDVIERTMVCWQSAANKPLVLEAFPKEELAAIAAAYGATPEKKQSQKHTFSGHFVGEMPKDLDNTGPYTRWNSPFGATSAYSERFGGNDDLVAQMQSLSRANDRFCDLVIAWLDAELKNEAKWKQLRPIVDTKIRHDLLNLVYTILLAAGGQESFASLFESSEANQRSADYFGLIFARLLQQLIEHDYLEVTDIPAFARLLGEGKSEVEQYLLNFVKRFLRKQLGMAENESLPPSFGFLSNFETLGASWNRYLRTTPEFQKAEEDWNEKRKKFPMEKAPRAEDVTARIVIGDDKLLIEMFSTFNIFANGREVEIVLLCPVRPVTTNGSWNEAEGRVVWKVSKQGSFGLPPLAEAIWSEPNADEQKKRFGDVILTGANLSGYVIWYAGLNQQEAKEWDAFVETWKPGADFDQLFEAFRFSTELLEGDFSKNAGTPRSLAEIPRDLIRDALKKKEAPAPPTP